MSQKVGRMIKAKMVLHGVEQRALARKLGKSQPYLSQRVCGHQDFSRVDMLVVASELEITSGKEFLAVFFPEIEWDDLQAKLTMFERTHG